LSSDVRVSLRQHLAGQVDGANALIAYLTLGDPVEDFLSCSQSILDSGAVTLELGIPLDSPKEGDVLLASHSRARMRGIGESEALALLSRVHEANPRVPLIAVNHWPALGCSDALTVFVGRAAAAGASAVLIVGLPFGQLGPFRVACDDANVESVLSCFSDTPKRLRAMIYRQCTGCVYIARSRGESGGDGAVSVDDLCREMRAETDIPLIVGFGIDDAAAVERVCRAGAKAAVVGSALVNRIAQDPASGAKFISALLTG
jgi:tryptophan synthase alpha chain